MDPQTGRGPHPAATRGLPRHPQRAGLERASAPPGSWGQCERDKVRGEYHFSGASLIKNRRFPPMTLECRVDANSTENLAVGLGAGKTTMRWDDSAQQSNSDQADSQCAAKRQSSPSTKTPSFQTHMFVQMSTAFMSDRLPGHRTLRVSTMARASTPEIKMAKPF